jgi:hypothetical protein
MPGLVQACYRATQQHRIQHGTCVAVHNEADNAHYRRVTPAAQIERKPESLRARTSRRADENDRTPFENYLADSGQPNSNKSNLTRGRSIRSYALGHELEIVVPAMGSCLGLIGAPLGITIFFRLGRPGRVVF